MNRPTWATVVGILGIIMGAFGILGGAQMLMMPMLTNFQQTMMEGMTEELEARSTQPSGPPVEMFRAMSRMWEAPPWLNMAFIAAGIVGILLSALYLLAAIWLLQVKPSAIGLFYLVAGASLAFAVAKLAAGLAVGSFTAISLTISGVFDLVFSLVMLVVVASGDKKAFLAPTACPK